MKTIQHKLNDARRELACQTCGNNPRGHMGNECPECHGELRNTATIALLEEIVEEIAIDPAANSLEGELMRRAIARGVYGQ
jgi:recombinational DNA repair protein RecR